MMMTAPDAQPGADYAAMRAAMVASQLRPNAVSDGRLVAAMAAVPREAFLPAKVAGQAYCDTALPLGGTRRANLPIATGRLLNAALVQPGERVLLLGAAGGYVAAVLAQLGAVVVAVEPEAMLHTMARQALAGVVNVTLVNAPLAMGHAALAPYHAIIIDGAVEQVPQALVDQLAIGGRLAAGLVDRGVTRLAMGRRTAGGFALAAFADVECVALPGFAVPTGFVF